VLLKQTPGRASDKFDGWGFYSAKELYGWCGSANSIDQERCASYVCGIFDAWSAETIVTSGKVHTYSICLKAGTSCHEISKAVQDYMTRNPEVQKSGAGGAVGYALQQTYPCQKK
jgi:hypothetical protein